MFNSIVRRPVEHEKINFISATGHVIVGLSCKHTNDDVFDDFRKISGNFLKISEDFSKLFRRKSKLFRTFFGHFLKITEDFRRQPKISGKRPMMFRSYSNTPRYFLKELCNHSNGNHFGNYGNDSILICER